MLLVEINRKGVAEFKNTYYLKEMWVEDKKIWLKKGSSPHPYLYQDGFSSDEEAMGYMLDELKKEDLRMVYTNE